MVDTWARTAFRPGDQPSKEGRSRQGPLPFPLLSFTIDARTGSTSDPSKSPRATRLPPSNHPHPNHPDLHLRKRMDAQYPVCTTRPDGFGGWDECGVSGLEGGEVGAVDEEVVVASACRPWRWSWTEMGELCHTFDQCRRSLTYPLLLCGTSLIDDSKLSHQSLPHLAFNSIALISFGSSAYLYLSLPPGPPPLSSSTHTPHFLAFLLCAGLTSSLASHLWTNIVRLPRLLRSLSSPARLSSAQALAAHQAIIPSLGASGAIYAALTLTACAYPDSQVGIIFVPFIRMPIGPAVAGIVSLDLIGLIRGWRSVNP